MIEFPLALHIETTGYCNSRCSFCPHSRSPRKHTTMSQELFDSVIKQARDIPHPFCVSPFKLGEPLLDPQFSQRLRIIDEVLPLANIELHTNLNHLPPDFIPALQEIKRVSHVWVSLNQRTTENYFEETGLQIDKTISNLDSLLAAKIPHRVVVGRVADYSDEDRKWFEWAKTRFPGATCIVMYRGNWCDNIDAKPVAKIPEGICPRTYEFSICCDGKVALCCMDGLCEYSLGDMNTQSMLSIYNSPKAKAMRQMKNRNIKPCDTCTFI